MFFDLNSVLTTVILCLITSWFIDKVYAPIWVERARYKYADVADIRKSLIWAGAYGVLSTVTLGTFLQYPYMSTAIGFFAFLAALSAQFDQRSHLVPMELSNLTVLSSVILGAVGLLTGGRIVLDTLEENRLSDSLVNLLIYSGFIFAIFFWSYVLAPFLRMRIPIGYADIVFFFSAGLVMSWYVGIIGMMLMFVIANLIMFGEVIWKRLVVKTISGKSQGVPALPAYSVAVVLAPIVLFVTS